MFDLIRTVAHASALRMALWHPLLDHVRAVLEEDARSVEALLATRTAAWEARCPLLSRFARAPGRCRSRRNCRKRVSHGRYEYYRLSFDGSFDQANKVEQEGPMCRKTPCGETWSLAGRAC